MKPLSRAVALVLTLALSFGPTLAFAQLTPPVTPPVTPPADTTPPVISGVATSTILPTGATLVWTTNELAVSTFEYGTTMSYGSSASISAGAAIGGTVTLTGLSASTAYYYCIHATDTSGNTSQSCSSFTTAAAPDVSAPIVFVIVAVATTTSVTITWTTSENADAQVEYGTTASYGSTSNLNSTLGLTHSIDLSNLSPNTTYHYRVLSHDAAGNLATGSDTTFTTSALPSVSTPVTVTDTIPPVITDISSVSLEPHDASIIWTTDELATSQLEYGTSMSYGSTATFPTDALLSHSATLLNLQANTKYYYCIHATDLFTNTSSSCSSSNYFTTAAQQVTLDTIPPTISLVTVAPITTTTAGVTWTTNEVGNGYIQYGTTDGYGSETQLNTALTLTHNAFVSGLTSNTTYHYRVVSSDEAGNVSMTPDETFTTAAPAAPADTTPPAITNIVQGSIGSTNTVIDWTTNEPAVSTLEYGTTTSYGSAATLSPSALLSHAGTLTGLSPSTTYYYCIHATDLAGNTVSSCGHSFTTTAGAVVRDTTPPVIWTITVASLATSSATLTWVSDEPTDSQVVYGTTASYGSQTGVTSSFTLDNSATLSNLLPNTTYHFQIRSSDSSGNLATSSDETFTTDALPVVVVQTPSDITPPVISGIEEASLLATSTNIAWQTNELATSTLEYGTTMSYGSIATLSTSALLTHSATILNLAPGTAYYYCIHATDLAGNMANSCGHSFTTEAASVVTPQIVVSPQTVSSPAPQNTAVAAVISSVGADSLSQTGATITWTTNVPSDSRVEYGDNMEFDQTASDATLATSHSVMLTGLDSDTNYDFRVVSTPVGVGAMETTSNVYDFNTLAVPVVIDPPANILSVTTGTINATNVSVSWTTDETTNGSVEYGLSSAYGLTAAASTSIQTSGNITLANLIPNTTYHYRVKAVDAADNITYSEDHTFTTPASLSGSTSTSTLEVASTTVEIPQSAPVVIASSGGGGGGSVSSIPTPALITAASVDSQIVFMWNNPESGKVAGTIIVRKEGVYPGSPQDGQVIYQGNATTFSDTNLQNGKTYYYTAYSYTAGGQYSNPIHIATAPVAGVMQVQLDENPVLQPGLANDHFPTDLRPGDKNLEVEHLQQILNTVNVHPSGLTTGYFGPLTASALKTFQAKYQLPQTGIADAATRAVLSSLSQSWMIPNAPNGLADLQTDLKRGDTGQDVSDLQEFLDYEGSYEEGIISGTYGPLTQESVADFQTKHGVTPVSGYVGYKTRHTIQTVLGL